MRPATFLGLTAALFLAPCTPPSQYPVAKNGDQAVTPQPPVQRQRQSYLARTAQQPVACTMGSDCNEKWSRALQWVSAHSRYSIKTSTESEIATYGPIEPTTDAAFDITRSGLDATTMAIRFSATCGQNAACVPTTLELNAEFKSYLLTGSDAGSGDY